MRQRVSAVDPLGSQTALASPRDQLAQRAGTVDVTHRVAAPDAQAGKVSRGESGQLILEIDHRPALDVYDDWLGGEIGRLVKEHQDRFDNVRGLLTLHPLYRKYTRPDGAE